MPKTKQQKEQIVKNLVGKVSGAKSAIIANHEGLTVNDSKELRDSCRKQKIEFFAVKKTLLKLALKQAGFNDVDTQAMQGSLAIAIGAEDEILPAKILKDFAKKHEQVVFCGGILNGVLVSAAEVKTLANLPSKLELLARVVGSIKAPVSGFVNVLRGNLSGLLNVLIAIKNNK